MNSMLRFRNGLLRVNRGLRHIYRNWGLPVWQASPPLLPKTLTGLCNPLCVRAWQRRIYCRDALSAKNRNNSTNHAPKTRDIILVAADPASTIVPKCPKRGLGL